jgi:glycosyltransferase involved in cell wall biosynthesis
MIRILAESLADEGLTNAQMCNAREIICRLDPERFHVSLFVEGEPDRRIERRPKTRLIRLPRKRQTATILREFVLGGHDVLFYVKASPASRWYTRMRRWHKDKRVTIATIESRSNWRDEPSITPANIELIEQTVLRCDRLFSNSKAVQQSLLANYGLSSEVVPTGVDRGFFVPALQRPENPRPRAIFVGSLRPFKGPQTVLAAAARLPHMDFVLTGDGPLRQELEEQARRLGNVALTGMLKPEQVREQLQKSDIFLFPSRWEGSPKVIMEAAACGLPVIARRDYEPETVLDGKTGYLAGDDDELLARVAELAASPGLRRAMGVAGRHHMQQFDWDIVARRWEEVFLRCAEGRNGGAAA